MEINRFYANRHIVSSSVFDFQIQLINKEPIINENGEVQGEETIGQANIVMSPEHAKTLYNSLGAQLQQYEKLFGKIIIEPSTVDTQK